MSIESRSNQYGTVFEHWQIQELLGQGSGGKTAVFLLNRNDSFCESCALKVINLIEERGCYNDFPAYRKKEYDDALKECKAKATPEVQMMLDLRGNTNVVAYLDHQFHNWSDSSGFGCDLLIRMELLEDLRSIIRNGKIFTEREVLKIGRDIGNALVLCHSNGILHRDIKPENILVNKKGDYKLGDFGISRLLSASPAAMATTGIGTPEYAAPEQFIGKYDHHADIYSLGLVLYELSNRNRLPFATSSYARQEDIQKRQMGTPLPKPEGISAGLWKVIQKACAYKAADRYSNAQEFLEDLCRLDDTKASESPQPEIVRQQTNQTVKATGTDVWRNMQKTAPAVGENATQYAGADAGKWKNSRETVYANPGERKVPVYQTAEGSKKWLTKGAIVAIAAVLALIITFLLRGNHEHTWINATCTAPRTCEECGETEGNSLGHTWSDATCTAPRTCEECGETEGNSLGHTWSDATCTTPSTCLTCGETNGSALGHRWIAATYETPKTCDVCGATEGEALVRSWIYINELSYIDNDGKVWTMSNEEPGYYADSDITDSEAYKNESIPGHVTGPVYDYLGNSYTYGLCVDGLDYAEYSVTYYLGGEYTTFSGYVSMTWDVRWDSAAEKGKYFEVYGDGELLGRSPTMTNSLPAQSFNIDITGVEYLTIRYPKTTGPSRMAMIFDGKLS